MRPISLLVLILFALLSCTSSPSSDNPGEQSKATNTNNQNKVEKKRTPLPPRKETSSIKQETSYQATYLSEDEIAELETLYPATPLYVDIEDQRFYIVSEVKIDYISWDGGNNYGIADQEKQLILPIKYNKIYNPNISLKDCFEIRYGDLIGLFNYRTKELLEPQFDFILPLLDSDKNKALGFKAGQWFAIDAADIKNPTTTNINPSKDLDHFSIDIEDFGPNLFINSYAWGDEYDAEGNHVAIIPSHLEYFNFFSEEVYLDIIFPTNRQSNVHVDGTENIELETKKKKSIGDKINSFFISVLESGIDAREYTIKKEQMMVYNQANGEMKTYELFSTDTYSFFCNDDQYRFINDTLIEIKGTNQLEETNIEGYDIKTQYRYLAIQSSGEVKSINSNRYYDFTKYLPISNNYFQGCFASYFEPGPEDNVDENMYHSEHLSIADLELMRNEIYADYGYKFKSKKWQDYFSRFDWYKAEYDSVEDQLTATDRANIALIQKTLKAMEGQEETYTKKRKIGYGMAG